MPLPSDIPELDDTSPMPLGKEHRGVRMEKVPAGYLHYLWTSGIRDGTRQEQLQVADYIDRHLSALKDEYPNGIW